MNANNRNLLIVVTVLLIANMWLAFSSNNHGEISFDERKFTVGDTAAVSRIAIGEQVVMTRSAGKWLLNDTLQADASLNRLLFSIMMRVNAKKPVEVAVDKSTRVTIDGEDQLSFYVWGNPTKTKTYFALTDDLEVYEVHIPGYNEYLGGIFELAPDQWRDRLLVNASWRTIQHLTVDYVNESEEELDIAFEENFFTVKGINALDSNAVIYYLNQFEHFQVNEWLSAGRMPLYDELAKTEPIAIISIETINNKMPVTFEIYKNLDGAHFNLGKTADGNLFVIDQKRIVQMLVKKEAFVASIQVEEEIKP